MQRRWNGTLHVHPQFGTATVTPADPNLPKIDFVTARCETYKTAGALPIVARGTLTDDLYRRDFSIKRISHAFRSELLSVRLLIKQAALKTLRTAFIRVLHTRSFTDDPTRIFRACRYAGRYGFRIANTDTPLIQEALSVTGGAQRRTDSERVDRILLEGERPADLTTTRSIRRGRYSLRWVEDLTRCRVRFSNGTPGNRLGVGASD